MSAPFPVLGFEADKKKLYAWQVPIMGWYAAGTSWAPLAVGADGTLAVTASLSGSLPAGSALLGSVGIDQTTPGTTNKVFITDISAAEYETVAAGQTGQVLGTTGAVGDYLSGILVIPATTGAGSISILDGATSISIFVTGTLSNLVPFFIPIGAKSVSGAWSVTTGANVSVFASGNFT